MPGGRPLKFATPEEFEAQAEAYFAETPIEKWTITGLALALDTTRDILCDYQLRDEFTNTIKRVKLKVEHAYELRGMEKGTAFDIFRLKNMGWKDKIETDNTTRHQIDRVELLLVSADGKPQG